MGLDTTSTYGVMVSRLDMEGEAVPRNSRAIAVELSEMEYVEILRALTARRQEAIEHGKSGRDHAMSEAAVQLVMLGEIQDKLQASWNRARPS